MPADANPSSDGAQQIPRPPDARPGRPAPWAALPGHERRGIGLDALSSRLAAAGRSFDVVPPEPLDELSGLTESATSLLRDSAVLVALFEDDGVHVVLTRRSSSMRRHRGQVSFPGGGLDEGELPLAAALREAHEEVGIEPSSVEPVAWLRPIVTFASGSIIRPYVGRLARRPTLVAQPIEVARAFDVSLDALLADGSFHEEWWRRPSPRAGSGDGSFPIFFFEVDGETVWGATARILTELCCLAVGVPLP